MRLLASSVIAAPLALAASVAVGAAQTGARDQARETKQETKAAASNTGNAIKDSWTTMKVHSQFVPEDALEGSDIDVTTKAGAVTLTGTVRSSAGKARAVAIAKATEGVKSVTDNLRVVAAEGPGSDAGAKTRETGRTAANKTGEAAGDAKQGPREAGASAGRAVTDGWIKSKLAAQYVAEKSLDNSDIDIDVEKGAVMLKGAVRTAAAKERATAIAKGTEGVRSVKNDLKVDANAK